MNTDIFKTSELANKAGVNKETIRFYENKGLLSGLKELVADIDNKLFH